MSRPALVLAGSLLDDGLRHLESAIRFLSSEDPWETQPWGFVCALERFQWSADIAALLEEVQADRK